MQPCFVPTSGQTRQARSLAGKVLVDPTWQSTHAVALGAAFILPWSHSWHSASPVSLPNFPGRQGRHDAWLVRSW